MNKKRYQQVKDYRLIDQMVAINLKFPDSKATIKNGVLQWSGCLKPTAISRTYHVELEYRVNMLPIVRLIGDNILGIDKLNFPHKFYIHPEKKFVELCLYYTNEFNSRMLIADTIIPWAVEWLFFYELWLATDVWCGGGKHPDLKRKIRR